ncbi:hypothetical protein KP509_04G011300 [Ceratopteris richardii]|uniref:Uncharacterized protein n=1 Tax=Ceratopteris richardii TaxID=49495 RepID=A0A8T2UUC3_CERRI|nr:hypothetical protein KP509_04G011300 [Ceratopteris richardii]
MSMDVSFGATSPFVVYVRHPASGLIYSYYVAAHDCGVDVGDLASQLSLEPSSVRFNGHFISRNANLVSSLTWRELLTFFQSKNLQSGSHPLNPMEVQGRPLTESHNKGVIALNSRVPHDDKLCKVKRAAGVPTFTSPFKRRKEMDLDVQTLPFHHKLKRRILADESTACMQTKCAQHEMNPGSDDGKRHGFKREASAERDLCQSGLEDGHDKDYGVKKRHGLKRQASAEDICMESSIWKRLKEIKV